jgi:hypothetical protein
MGAALVAVVVLAAVLARPIAVRLWLAGMISDRALFVASVARFPALVLTFGLLLRVPIPLLVLLTVLSLVPGLLLSRVVRDVIHEHSPDR